MKRITHSHIEAMTTMNISINPKFGRRLAEIAGVAFLAVSLAACGLLNPSDPSDSDAADETAAKLSSQLSLSTNITDSLRDALHLHGGGNPAPLWAMAAELQKTLTPEQKQILFSGGENYTDGEIERHDGLDDDDDLDTNGCHAGYPMDGFRHIPTAEMMAADSAAMVETLGLTAEQIAALYNLKVEQRAAMDSLKSKFDAGTIDRATLATELTALRAARDAALATILDATELEIVKIHEALIAHLHGHEGRDDHDGHHGRGHRDD